jgi:hypothetical protein
MTPEGIYDRVVRIMILMSLVAIFIVLVNFTRSPVTIISVQEADEIVQIEQLDREVRALKKKVGLQ